MVAGLLAVALLPDFPRSGQRKWLSEQEQRFAEWRLARAANDEVDENGSIREGLRDAFLDPKAWMLILIQVCQLTSQSWTYFFPVSIKQHVCRYPRSNTNVSLDHCQDIGIQQHHHTVDHGPSLRLRLHHRSRQFLHCESNEPARSSYRMAPNCGHRRERHGYLVASHCSQVHRNVLHVRWLIFCVQRRSSLDRQYDTPNAHQAGHCVRIG